MGKEKVTLVGYGTLLLKESLSSTVNGETKVYKPVVIKNYRRLFNLLPTHYNDYTVDNHLRDNWTEKAAANIEYAEGMEFNGLAFEADADDLVNLDARERYYKRSQATCYDFETGEELGICHVYETPLDAPWLVRDVDALLPLWRDLVYARNGAYRISEAFGKMYDATTYLADGKTLAVDYYKDYLKKLEDLDSVQAFYSK